MENLWNIPDWRDTSAYPDHEKFPVELWRWEFIRRSKEYRDSWQAYQDELDTFKSEHPNSTGRLTGRIVVGPTNRTFRKSYPGQGEQYACCFGLRQMLSPATAAAEVNPSNFVSYSECITHPAYESAYQEQIIEGLDQGLPLASVTTSKDESSYANNVSSAVQAFVAETLKTDRVLVSINPNQKLEPQFERVKKEFAEIPSSTRLRLDQYELALRLIDARSLDRGPQAKWKEIEKVIGREPCRGKIELEEFRRKLKRACENQKKFLNPYYWA